MQHHHNEIADTFESSCWNSAVGVARSIGAFFGLKISTNRDIKLTSIPSLDSIDTVEQSLEFLQNTADEYISSTSRGVHIVFDQIRESLSEPPGFLHRSVCLEMANIIITAVLDDSFRRYSTIESASLHELTNALNLMGRCTWHLERNEGGISMECLDKAIDCIHKAKVLYLSG